MGIRFLCFLMCLGFHLTTGISHLPSQELSNELRLHLNGRRSEVKLAGELQSTTEPKSESKQQSAQTTPSDNKTPSESKAESLEPETPLESDSKPAAVIRLHSTELLPIATKAWFSVPDLNRLEDQFDETQYGKLAADPAIKPFVDSIKEQARDWLDEKNVRLGVRVEDIDRIHTGEICIAGVLQDLDGGQPARGSHGLVLLVEVAGNESQVAELFAKVNRELETKKGAVQESIEINGVTVTKLTINNPKRIRHNQFSFQATHNGWLLVADNEEIFRDIIRRITAPDKIVKQATLSMYLPFTEIMKQTDLFGNDAQFSWYVDPFGYLKLVQKIEEEEQDVRQHDNNWPRILQEQGFDAIRGMGGNIALAISANGQDYELLNRGFVYAPRTDLGQSQQRVFDLFDFRPANNAPPIPALWVPADASGYFSANWDFSKLLNSIGHVYDAFMGDEGEFERMISDFKDEPDFQIDVPRLVGMLDNEFSIVSTTERPITESSERVVVGLRLKQGGDADFIFRSLKRAVGRKNGKLISLAGFDVIEVDTTIEPEPMDLEEELQLPPGFDDLNDDGPAAPPEQRFSLFEKRYFVVHQGFLLVANDKLYLKKLLTANQKIRLQETDDYVQIFQALDRLIDVKKVSFRQFARVDRSLEANYEMLRRGEMAKSKTVLAKILNKIFQSEDQAPVANQPPRNQKLDGSKLPENFEKSVAPYLGPSAWVLETEPDGWRVTGCALKKKPVSEIVKKLEVGTADEKSQR